VSTVTRTIDIAAPPGKAWHWIVTPEKQLACNAQYAKAYELLEGAPVEGDTTLARDARSWVVYACQTGQ
jgi:hypothetical protein